MEVDLEQLKEALEAAETIVLSTSNNDIVTARPVSIMSDGLTIYVRTDENSRKALQMKANPNIAVCVGSFYGEGQAKSAGYTSDVDNKKLKRKYIQRYPGAFSDADVYLSDTEVFYEITLSKVFQWVYDGGLPAGLAEKAL